MVYKAEVHAVGKEKRTYFGLTARKFKNRYSEHKNSFKDEKKRSSTRLAEYIWALHDENIKWEIKWSIHAKGTPYKPGDKFCGLCLEEKVIIALSDPKKTLNSRSEIVSKCRHRKEHKLKELL